MNKDEDYELENDTTKNVAENLKITDWRHEPTVADLKADYEGATGAHNTQVGKINRYLDNLNVTGSAKPKTRKNASQVQPKLIRKQAEWRYASLAEPFLSTPDIFNVSGVTFEDVKAAQQNELVLNYQFNNRINKVKFINDYVRTAVNEGSVIIRTGWNFREKVVDEVQSIFEYTPSIDLGLIKYYQDLMTQEAENPALLDLLPEEVKAGYLYSMRVGSAYVATKVGEEEVEIEKVVANHPTAEVVNSKNTIIDPSCEGDMDKAKFVIYSFETSLSDLEEEGVYHNLEYINPRNHNVLAEPDHESESPDDFNFKDEARKKFVAYEYWGFRDVDGSGELTSFVATYVGDVMIRMEENPFPDGKLPFIVVPYLPVKGSVYGEPDGSLIEDNQKIIGAVTRGIIDMMAKSANGQRGYSKEALDLTNKRKFENGQDYEFNPGTDPRSLFHVHKFEEIPQSAAYMLDLQNADAESMSGVKAFSSGLSGQALGNTATGIRSALDATAKRELDILNRLAEGIKETGRRFISMNSEFLEDEEVIRITNDKFVPVRKDDLAGEFDLNLSISTAETDNQKAQELAFMLQTNAASMDQGEVRLIRAEIARLRKMPDLAKRIEEYQPQTDPVEEKRKQLEVAKLEYEIAELQAKTVKLRTGAQLDIAKAGTEQAKQGNLQSDTDLKDLTYVEQESSTTHEREIDKIKTQAKEQGKQKIAESVAKAPKGDETTTVYNGNDAV